MRAPRASPHTPLALLISTIVVSSLLIDSSRCDISNAYLSTPNRSGPKSLERPFGFGFVFPFPYYQKPKYRYPVYDRSGRGALFYGYGGPEMFQYKQFTPLEGHH